MYEIGRYKMYLKALLAKSHRIQQRGIGLVLFPVLVGLVIPLRVESRQEGTGLDVPMHGEEAYSHGEGALLLLPRPAAKTERPASSPSTQPMEHPA